MNFEKIEMYGFKSFADKQEIRFENGITGIVGPNGCGKSNIADAIRWVLGEASAKTLRGSTMSDVIFSGTQSRKSLSYCEVSLYFDNTSRMFSIDYNEVIITRKLYRNGDSEYLINKQPVRKKDIIDLLHECGIGKEGYSIIGQGKVQEIMSAKPEDRRAIFEEATGVAKFRGQKNELENKQARTNDNLAIIENVIAELENSLAPLEKQAEKTKAYKELSTELKRHEINVFISKCDNVATEKKKINTKLQGLSEEIAVKESDLSKTNDKYNEVFLSINTADDRLSKLNDELLTKRESMLSSEGSHNLIKERISSISNAKDAQLKQKEENKNKKEENERKIALLKEDKEKTEGEIDSLNKEIKTLSGDLEKVKSKLLEGENLAEEHNRKIMESIQSLSAMNVDKGSFLAEKNTLIKNKEELSSALTSLKNKREELLNKKDSFNAEISSLDKEIYNLGNRIEKAEETVKALNEKTADIDNKIYNLNSNISMLVAKENMLSGLHESFSS